MKRYVQIISGALGLLCLMTACSGSDDAPGVPEGVLRITADKNSVQADGIDVITVKAMYGSSDVSNSEHIVLVQVFDGQETVMNKGVNTFTTTKPGPYIIKARYSDGDKLVESDNSINVTASAVAEAKKYYLKMLAMQFTSIGCINCPAMSTALKLIQEEQPGRLAVASFHIPYDPAYPDPMYIAMGQTYANKLNVKGLPTGFINLNPTPISSIKTDITKAMDAELKTNSGQCGVAIESSYNTSTREVSVQAKVTSNTTASYRYLILLVEDGIQEMQLGADTDYRHNNVVRDVLSTNIYGERLNLGKPLQPGVEVIGKRTATIANNWDVEKMRVIAVALITKDDGITYVCTNANECKLGESADYLFINE